MADRRSVILRPTQVVAAFFRRIFPERQILIRDHGRVRCFRLSTLQQVGVTAAIAACVLWALLSTAAYVDGAERLASKEDEIAHRTSELDGLKANYQAAFSRLDEFQTVFSGITCEISDIQNSLLRITEKSVAPPKHGAVAGAMPRLDPDANGCRGPGSAQIAAAPAAPPEGGDTRRIVGSLRDGNGQEQDVLHRRVTQLEETLDKLRASHGAFLQNTANLTAMRAGELEKTLAAAGFDPKTVVKPGPYGRGGPFIAARPGTAPQYSDVFSPIALFNAHADRLDSLSNALKNLPLSPPLADYEVTSPFGARNDPINAMSGIHEGVDLGAPIGTPVMATGAGQVTWSGWRDRYGVLVEIDHGMGVRTRYAHLSKAVVNVGDRVGRGTTLGLVGATGRTTGPHLHYEVRMDDEPTNPMKFIAAGENVFKTP